MKGSLGTSASLKGNNFSPRTQTLIALKQSWRIVKGDYSQQQKKEGRRAITRLQEKFDNIKPHKTEAEFRKEKEEYIQRMRMIR